MTQKELQNTLVSWKNAMITFDEILQEKANSIVRDAAIKRFEYNFELAWKSIKRFAKKENFDATSPRSAFKVAFQVGWIDDAEVWLDMIDDRNLTTHTYKEATAEEVFERLPRYAKEMQELLDRLMLIE